TFRPVTFNVTLGFEPVGVWLDPGLDGVVGLEPVLVELLAPLDGPCWPVIGKVTWSERRLPSSTHNACTFTVDGLELNTSTAARPFESVIGHTRRRPSFSASEFRPLSAITIGPPGGFRFGSDVPGIVPVNHWMSSALKSAKKHTVSPTNGAPVMSCASATQIAACCSTGCEPFG